MAFAVNLGAEHKVRPSLRRMLRNRHPVVVKWLVRRAAEAHLPPHLAYRRKRGFPTTGLRRLVIRPSYFEGGWLAGEMEVAAARPQAVREATSEAERVRLLQLDLWGRLLIRHEPLDAVTGHLLEHVTMRPE